MYLVVLMDVISIIITDLTVGNTTSHLLTM